MKTQRHSLSLPLLTLASLVIMAASPGCSADTSTMSTAGELAKSAPSTVDPGADYSRVVHNEASEDMVMDGEKEGQMAPEAPLEEMEMADAAAPVTMGAVSSRDAKRERRAERKKGKSKASPGKRGDIAGGAVAGAKPVPAAEPPMSQVAKVATPTPTDKLPTAHAGGEDYDHFIENEFLAVADKALSTFSIDVDTASYSNSRRFIRGGQLPPTDAVRIEEFINYFSYDYPQPTGKHPFSVTAEVSDCPWNDDARLVHVGLQGKTLKAHEIPGRNLVFLMDVSGSMNNADKLPLLKQAFAMLTQQLDEDDRVSIVVYAGASGVVLPPTSGEDQHAIMGALERLRAGGSTNGGAGIELAYSLARKNFIQGGINRVVLATDGDFNVGTTSRGALTQLIERERETGVFLSVLGFGSGNTKDSTMEMLADKGNGNYAYIDSVREAKKVLVEEAGSTLVTIAKDVKIQVEFNPAQVESYRLVGYENRRLADRDFHDDTKDAGEIGAGHSVTALYEVIPAGSGTGKDAGLKYQKSAALSAAASSGELMTVKLRYKKPEGSRSTLLSFPISDDERTLARASKNFRFSAAVAGFAMLVRDSKHAPDLDFAGAHALAKSAIGQDPNGYRREFLSIVEAAGKLRGVPTLAVAR
jgi:Ca-activated chloride channel family protein